MQTTGHLVGAFFELAAGMEDRHDDVDGGDAGAVHRHRDAAAVVGDLDATVFEDADVDLGGEAGHRLVHRVVDDFPHQVVQAPLTGGPDVHAWTLAHRLQALENLDRLRAVGGWGGIVLRGGSHSERVSLGLCTSGRAKRSSRVCVQSTFTYRQH